MIYKTIIKYIQVFVFAVMVFNPTLVLAQTAATSTTNIPSYSGVESSLTEYLCTPDPTGKDSRVLEKCVNKLYRFGIAFGAIALVFFIVFAGYMYITGGETGKQKGKAILGNALIGMALLLGSYLILSFINPSLVIFKPIQPPIFDAANLPSCAEVGLGEKCVLPNGDTGVGDGTGGTCAMPMAASAVAGYNNSIHNSQPNTDAGHGPLGIPPVNSPAPQGIVDLLVRSRTPVFAPISGKVVTVSSLGVSGDWIRITSDTSAGSSGCGTGKNCTNMGHIDPSVSKGQIVQAGQQVGTTTVYNGAFGPHLHFELKLNGQWVLGDGFKGTWDKQQAAISSCKAAAGGGGGGNTSAVAVDMSTPPSGMVEVTAASHGVIVNMKYASSDNFTGTALYKQAKCYLTQTASNQLKVAQTAMTTRGKKLEVLDCYRPTAVQTLMNDWAKGTATWAVKKPTESFAYYVPKYIAASTGGNHPAGKAIDLTISGASMPSAFDTFSSSASYNSNNADAKLLRETMENANFSSLPSEWWHFVE